MQLGRGHSRKQGVTSGMSEKNIGGDVSEEADYFGRNMQQYMRDNLRPHPDWFEVFQVAMAMGYRKPSQKDPMI